MPQPLVTFHQVFPDAPRPHLADPTLAGTIQLRALKHCEPFTAASGFGWYVYPPLDFSLMFEGDVLYWKERVDQAWRVLDEPVILPGFAEYLENLEDKRFSERGVPPFLGRAFEPGLVQLWAGLLIETRPGWSTLVRPLANFPRDSRFEVLDGLIETEWWFGPLVTPIRIRKTDEPIRFLKSKPLYQIQPVPTEASRRQFLADFEVKSGVSNFDSGQMEKYLRSLPQADEQGRIHGRYRSEVHQRVQKRRST